MKELIIAALQKSISDMGINYDGVIEISRPKQKENGDYASNIAMKLAGIMHDNPMSIAASLVDNFSCSQVTNIEIKAPGFINFFVAKDYLLENLKKVLVEKENYGRSNIGNGQKINIEFVSANPTGILHLGNARGGAYGDSLARIMRFCGFDVTEEYYINDAGNQINNLGESIKARYFEICKQDYPMPENGYFGKEIIAMAEEIYSEHQDTYLDKDIEFYIRSDKCSASIVIYDLLKIFKINLTPEVATYIYAGIVGDTDRFLHNNTTPEVFDCASQLVKAGADIQRVYDVVYRSMTMSQIHLRNFLFENLTEFSEKVCYVVVSKADLAKLHATVEDLKMFVNDINLIKKYSAVVVAYEVEDNNYKVSMRSKNNAEVLSVAVRHGGGGHKMAAGFSLAGNKRAVLSEIKKICKEF